MLIFLVIALIVLLVVVYPILQNRREKQLAEKLEATHSASEASALVDSAIRTTRGEEEFFRRLPKHHL